MPPTTSPLTPVNIGYGVVNVSYTRLSSEPDENSASPGHLRRGAVVKIVERRLVRISGRTESWVLTNGDNQGWIRESLVDVYDNDLQARTASNAMGN